MSRRTLRRLKEMLFRFEQEREQHKRDHPNNTAKRGQIRRDEDALREAIAILQGRPAGGQDE